MPRKAPKPPKAPAPPPEKAARVTPQEIADAFLSAFNNPQVKDPQRPPPAPEPAKKR